MPHDLLFSSLFLLVVLILVNLEEHPHLFFVWLFVLLFMCLMCLSSFFFLSFFLSSFLFLLLNSYVFNSFFCLAPFSSVVLYGGPHHQEVERNKNYTNDEIVLKTNDVLSTSG